MYCISVLVHQIIETAKWISAPSPTLVNLVQKQQRRNISPILRPFALTTAGAHNDC